MRDNDFFTWRRDMLHRFQDPLATRRRRFIISCNVKPRRWNMITTRSACATRCHFTRPQRLRCQPTYPRAVDGALSGRKLFRDRSCVTGRRILCRGHLAMERQPVSWMRRHCGTGRSDHGCTQTGVTQCLTLPNHAQRISSRSPRTIVCRACYPDRKSLSCGLRTLTATRH